ncbi:bifunctional helix-turn-helix transcriptional regulator/GNAT family N-acetyltransferase [Paradevosia shaoguanensis]|uniref:bifunctional helix-turn-helix transcriptional regulator/GNAT family N-acetyltransferase n=1 Tax=Paradevosia shaoguanensis TaxID=1335043 RepID=UPI0015FBE61A|nr:helix-turn-helix domain-containing GNAT family N-acetyltransferase [Paradevosia shaoguanensis]QMV03786.1 GNAT family N-acetyltransferase [Devosia sp. D6-9]
MVASEPTPTQIAEMRAFNRFYTRVVGALEAHLLASPFTLGEARVIYEIATRHQVSAAELSRQLGLDAGYLSRLLYKLVEAGIIALSPNPSDRRQNLIALTADGDAAFAQLDSASIVAVGGLLAPLAAGDRAGLVAAMANIRRLLGDDMPSAPVVLRPPRPGDIGHIVGRQAAIYADEYGWDASYEGLAAEIAGKFVQEHDPAREACIVAERAGEVVGSVFLVDAGDGVAQLRLLYVEPSARGLGIGKSLVAQCIAQARAFGYRRIKLWTQSVLVPARKIYAAAGFTLVRADQTHSFGQDLTSEFWELPL